MKIKIMSWMFALALFSPIALRAATYTASSCSQAAVQAAITAEQVSPADGDIIAIPAGTCTWTGTTGISQTFSNSVIFQGTGALASTTGGASTTGSNSTEIIDNISSTPDLALNTIAGKSLRFTAIALVQNSSSTRGANNGMLQILGSSTAVRIDSSYFYTINGGVGVRFDGAIQGVSDHDYFQSPSSSVTNDLAIHNGETWESDTSGNGDKSWTDTDHFGSSEFFFVEDCRFYNGYVLDAHDGARYVFRHNTVTGDGSSAQQVTGHGLTDARGRAVRAVELYDNTFSTPTAIGNPTFSLNSGALLFWGNTISQYKGAIEMDYTRKSNATYTYLAPPNGWGYCGTANGPSNWDENLDSTGQACLDAAARGAGDLLTGNFPTVCNSTLSCPNYTGTWPRQALDPAYVWDNSYTLPYASVNLMVIDTSMYQDNRDYYQQFGTYAEPGSFDGTKGVGQGLLSARPSTCTAGPGGNTPGVGYWATDTATLYVCNPTNTWTVHYTPYTYPNPLVGGSTVSPPSLSPASGAYSSPQTITLSDSTSGATLCFTTNGSTPTTDGNGTCTGSTSTYSTSFSLSIPNTVKAVGTKAGMSDSSVSSTVYILPSTGNPPTNLQIILLD